MRTISKIIIHHSASPNSTTLAEIDRWHRKRGYEGIGYHYVVEDDGAVLKGRDLARQGAHCKGANRDSIGICVTGDNTKPESRWNKDQIVGLVNILTELLARFGPLAILGHRDVPGSATLCPGLDVRQLLRDRIYVD